MSATVLYLPCATGNQAALQSAKLAAQIALQLATHHFSLQHHFFGDGRFVLAEGSELRGSFTREPLPEPYSVVVNGTFFDDPSSRQGRASDHSRVIVSSDLSHVILEAICMLS